jgi:hypothetical protein
MSGVRWGDVATWLSGAGTVGAVATALTFSLRQERREKESELCRVYGWMIRHDGEERERWELVISNGTEYPLYRWQVKLSWDALNGEACTDSVSETDVGLVPPGRQSYDWIPTHETPPVDAQVRCDTYFVDSVGGGRVRTSEGRLRYCHVAQW